MSDEDLLALLDDQKTFPSDFRLFHTGSGLANNALQLAGIQGRHKTLEKLVKKAGAGGALLAGNTRGQTPFTATQEGCQRHLNWRKQSLKRVGFGEEYLKCEEVLYRKLGTPPDLKLTRKKLGCTCGKCWGGLISLNTVFDLEVAAYAAAEELENNLHRFYCKTTASERDAMLNDANGDLARNHCGIQQLAWIPRELRKAMVNDRNFLWGYVAALKHFSVCLAQGNRLIPEHSYEPHPLLKNPAGLKVPPDVTITDASTKQAQHYFEEGGTAGYIIDFVNFRMEHYRKVDRFGSDDPDFARCANDSDDRVVKDMLLGKTGSLDRMMLSRHLSTGAIHSLVATQQGRGIEVMSVWEPRLRGKCVWEGLYQYCVRPRGNGDVLKAESSSFD